MRSSRRPSVLEKREEGQGERQFPLQPGHRGQILFGLGPVLIVA